MTKTKGKLRFEMKLMKIMKLIKQRRSDKNPISRRLRKISLRLGFTDPEVGLISHNQKSLDGQVGKARH